MTVSWVPSSWDAVKTGDRGSRVQIHRPTGFIEGTLEHRDAESVLIGFAAGQERGIHSTRFYRRDGWNLFIPAPTTPPLPTDPGTVIMWENGAYLPHIAHLDPKGRLGWRSDNGDNTERWFTPDALAGYIDGAPFVKLEPAATTAKQIIDRIDAMRAGGEATTLGQVQALLAAEFGVS